ncbi:hypothetical protein B0O80DRAFT_455534, partial [Mortierella sp. GBAus27b]
MEHLREKKGIDPLIWAVSCGHCRCRSRLVGGKSMREGMVATVSRKSLNVQVGGSRDQPADVFNGRRTYHIPFYTY